MAAICTQEEKRVYRLISMLNEEGRLVLRLCIFFLLPQFACKPFEEYLGQAQVKKRIEDALYKSKIITTDQFLMMFPKVGVPDFKLLDITLLVFLIRQLHPFLKPSNQIWTDPPEGNTSIEADISRIRNLRNRLSHTGIASLSEADFEIEYNQLETILCRLAGNVGKSRITPDGIKERLKKKKTGSFETKPVQIDISTNVSDSLERRTKSLQNVVAEDKTTSTSSLQECQTHQTQQQRRPVQINVSTHVSDSLERTESLQMVVAEDKTTSTSSLQEFQTHQTQQQRSGGRLCSFSKLCIFQSCCKDFEPRTFLTNDHTSLEYRCSITSIAVLQNGTLLATDTAHNVVEAFTCSGQQFEEFKCQTPNSVCAINHDTAAVSLCKEKKIILLNIACQSRSMISKLEYDVKCTCDILSVKYNSGFLYVLCEKGEVHTINSNTGTEQALYQTNILMPSYFDITSDGNKIYISKGSTITCLGLPGNCEKKYIDKTGRELKGIVVRRNKMYASVWDGGIVLKLNKDLTLVKEIFIDNLQNPMALCKFKEHLYLSKYRTDLDRYMCREIVFVKI
ncbi:uncharacterized protein LOC123562867 [Mercenaria mercenaria]|uniref:uncharacterized protein LOC123562867 n=1 Tax=Mercenaria mercenaria TaxID=6596 RepID=UPI00234F5FDC|nr:uncharacterized protein LOC123562867 [Mercenaria mercenaria]